MNLGPKNQTEEVVFAEENFRVDVQHRILSVMNKLNVSRAELARRMGKSEQHVSQLFASSANPTVKTIARIFYALGDECFISSKQLDAVAHNRQKLCSWALVVTQSAKRDASGCGTVLQFGALQPRPTPYRHQQFPLEVRAARSA
jgi:DNA-binding phage protein